MALTYYAGFRIEGTTTPQYASVSAASLNEAKKLIEARYGKVKSWTYTPRRASNPPKWFKG